MNIFIHPLNRFILKKNAYTLLVFFSWVPYMQLSHMIPGVNIIGRKVSECQQSWRVWECSETPVGLLRNFFDSKEHQNWLQIDVNVAEIITIQDYKHKKLVLMEVHMYSVKVKSQAGNPLGILKTDIFCQKLQQWASGSREHY